MIDLHCHILPGIDDGAPDPDTALGMLRRASRGGVDRVMLTPHFHPQKQPLAEFLRKRERSFALLQRAGRSDVELRLGAEVAYCAELLSMELDQLALGGSGYLLLELPVAPYPPFLDRMTQQMLDRGMIPVLAHVERCAYFRREPGLLKRQVELGALAQVTAGALLDRRDRRFARACLDHGLAQLVASDVHDLSDDRPGLEVLEKLPEKLRRRHHAFASAVWNDDLPPYVPTGDLNMTFFGYR